MSAVQQNPSCASKMQIFHTTSLRWEIENVSGCGCGAQDEAKIQDIVAASLEAAEPESISAQLRLEWYIYPQTLPRCLVWSSLVRLEVSLSRPEHRLDASIPVDLIFFRKHPWLIGLQAPRYDVDHHLRESILRTRLLLQTTRFSACFLSSISIVTHLSESWKARKF
ncbi:hypothetical protein J6590_080983 [Homalodisca vitripennis]|nr:hypothetical protein J6590_080983 [Homalodisca vitripennis]